MDNNSLIIKFWEYDIWNVDYKKIYHNKIKEIIYENNKLGKKLLYKNTMININENYDIEVLDHEYIINKIDKFKKDNLNYLKKHAECIPEYHFLLIELINKKLEITLNNYVEFREKHHLQYLIPFINYIRLTQDLSCDSNIAIHTCSLRCVIRENETLLNQSFEELYNKDIYYFYEKFIKRIYVNDNRLDNKIILKLRENIDFNIENIEKIKEIKKDILVLDAENILKSLKVQYLLKKHVVDYDKIYKTWNYGNLHEYIEIESNISLSEYSNNTKYIEPYISLGLTFKEKFELIKN